MAAALGQLLTTLPKQSASSGIEGPSSPEGGGGDGVPFADTLAALETAVSDGKLSDQALLLLSDEQSLSDLSEQLETGVDLDDLLASMGWLLTPIVPSSPGLSGNSLPIDTVSLNPEGGAALPLMQRLQQLLAQAGLSMPEDGKATDSASLATASETGLEDAVALSTAERGSRFAKTLDGALTPGAVGTATPALGDESSAQWLASLEGLQEAASASSAIAANDGVAMAPVQAVDPLHGVAGTRVQLAGQSLLLGSPQFAQAVQEQVQVMVKAGEQSAELQLDPPELGPLQVRVTTQGESAQVVLIASTAQVRDALDAAQQRLRDALEAQGFTSVDVDVRDQSQQPSQDEQESARGRGLVQSGTDSDESLVTVSVSHPVSGSGQIDQYV